MSEHRSVRILHVIGGMTRGGIETWLMHILRHIDRERFQMDFLVHTTDHCPYDDEVRALGSKIIPCPYPSHPPRYAAAFQRLLRAHGPYDVVHSHVHHYSGYVVQLAKWAGVPVRIAHSHNDTSVMQMEAGPLRRGYYLLMERLIARYATHGLAASRAAAANLFGPRWSSDPRWQVLHYGVDLLPFADAIDSAAIRDDLGLPADAVVIGHVGRFFEQKNHEFLVAIMAALAALEPQARMLLVGDGALRPHIEQRVRQAGVADRVVFAGSRPDVPRLMRGAMDVFVLPSLFEGLPLVVIEAQAAGLPCVLSDRVTTEIDMIPRLTRRLSLSHPPAAWAEAILAARSSGAGITQTDALATLQHSSFDIHTSLAHLENVYHVDSGAVRATSAGRVPRTSRQH